MKIELSTSGSTEIFVLPIPKSIKIKDIVQYECLLDKKEKEQLWKYKVEYKQIEFMLGRMLLKGIIGHLLEINPVHVYFSKNKYGKLFLEGRTKKNIHFNLSHTDGMLVCAISNKGEVGIDIEKCNSELLEAMKTTFTKKELEYTNIYNDKVHAYSIWTKKEAYLKYTGKGFALSPNSFTVPLKKSSSSLGNFKTFNVFHEYIVSIAVARCHSLYDIEELNLIDCSFIFSLLKNN